MTDLSKSTGLLLIATGPYTRYLEGIIDSNDRHFSGQNLTYFIFTDEKIDSSQIKTRFSLRIIPWTHKPWPLSTLLRYQAFVDNKSLVMSMDYLIYIDVDMIINCDLNEIINHNLFAVIHPGYRKKNRKKFPLEERRDSKAFIDKLTTKNYYCGGIQGGKSKEFIDLCEISNIRIKADLDNGIIAKWHDESHWNKAVNENIEKFKILKSEYCWPEEWSTKKYPGKIVAILKKPDLNKSISSIEICLYYLNRILNLFKRSLNFQRY